MEEKKFAERCREAGGTAYAVGGWVRDVLRGAVPHDKDYVVCGVTEEQFSEAFPGAERVGKAFPVYLVRIDGKKCEVAFARRERKAGSGYKGFEIVSSPELTIEEDLFRRDTTMNAVAMNLLTEEIIDPYGGREDIEAQIIRPVSEHFGEDPVRALRAARQSAELGFAIAPETYEAMGACREEIGDESAERIFNEMIRALHAPRPSVFFRAMEKADLLATVFPELHALIGKTQPVEFHPEGDSFEHIMDIVDKVAAKVPSEMARFAALVHDLGKGVTPKEMLPHHYGHELKGGDVLAAWNSRMTMPKTWYQSAAFVIREHMRAPRLGKPGKIVELLLAVDRMPLTPAEFKEIIRADHNTLPDYLENIEEIIPVLKAVSGKDAPAGCKGKAVGAWILCEQIHRFTAWKYRN